VRTAALRKGMGTMQVNVIGGGHGSDTHQVTSCLHKQFHTDKKTGEMKSRVSASSDTFSPRTQTQPEGQFSLMDWLRSIFDNVRGRFGNFWGGRGTGQTPGNGAEKGLLETESDNVRGELASAVVNPKTHAIQENPYFAATSDTEAQSTLFWRKAKMRIRNLTGQLGEKMPGRFFGFRAKNSFQSKQEKHREDRRRYSRYRQDSLEIDCVLTDDSYLLDSYDRKGEYTTLSARK